MTTENRNTGGQEAYAIAISEMTDEEFVAETASVVWSSAFANNNPRARAHWQADALIDESRRREKPWLYAQGRNKAIRTCGYELSEADIAAAQPLTARSPSSKEA